MPISSSVTDIIKRIDIGLMIARLKSFFNDAGGTWQQIKSENDSPRDLYEKYVFALVVIPAICTFIGTSLLGSIPLGWGIRILLFQTLGGVLGFFIGTMLIQFLAPHFGGTNVKSEVLKWLVFGGFPTAAAGALTIFRFLPVIGFLISLAQLAAAIFAIYLFWVGSPIILGISGNRRLPFFLSLIGAGLVIGLVLSFLGLGLL